LRPCLFPSLPFSIHFHSSADHGIVVGMWFVYMLRCANGSLYVGETSDVAQRLADHNRGRGAAHTSKHRPLQLAWVERHDTRELCLERERQLKRWSRAKKQALIAGDLPALKEL
jgi:predicted GIY-YIG superfamily endonuclease